MTKKKVRLPEQVRKIFVELGKQGARKGASAGGKARAAKLSPERRREIAKKALDTRWARVRAAKKKAAKS